MGDLGLALPFGLVAVLISLAGPLAKIIARPYRLANETSGGGDREAQPTDPPRQTAS